MPVDELSATFAALADPTSDCETMTERGFTVTRVFDAPLRPGSADVGELGRELLPTPVDRASDALVAFGT